MENLNENVLRNYAQANVYFDGSHYIAIPQGSYPSGKGCKRRRKVNPTPEQIECKEIFEAAYAESKKLSKQKREGFIDGRLKESIPNDMERAYFVAENTDRKKRNRSKRYTLLWRKVNLQSWNYFVTITFDSSKHTAETFQKSLKDTLKKLVMRRGWKYIGAWEHGKDTNRLHFHGLFVIPEGQMVGELIPVTDYSTTKHRMQTQIQNTYFLKRFGRNSFEKVEQPDIVPSVRYIIKYIEKEGGKLVQGGKLKPFFVSDILAEDVICEYGEEGKKIILADHFMCIDQGVLMGNVSQEVIDQMPKCN